MDLRDQSNKVTKVTKLTTTGIRRLKSYERSTKISRLFKSWHELPLPVLTLPLPVYTPGTPRPLPKGTGLTPRVSTTYMYMHVYSREGKEVSYVHPQGAGCPLSEMNLNE